MLITVNSFTLPAYNLANGSYTLRLSYSEAFLDSSGQSVGSGPGTIFEFPATVSGNLITFSPWTIYSTTDAQSPLPSGITASCQLYKGSSALSVFPFNQSGTPPTWVIPSNQGPSIGFDQLTLYNQSSVLTNPPQVYYTAPETDAAILAAVRNAAINQDYVISTFNSFAAAITALTAAGGTLVMNQATACPDNQTVPANIILRFTAKGSLTIASGKTCTIQGPLEADATQVFFGSGTVSFSGNASMSQFRPEWWGNNTVPGTTDMTTALQAALNAAASLGTTTNEGQVVLLANPYLSGDLTVDRSADDNQNRIGIIGSGTRSTTLKAKGGTSQLLLIQGNGAGLPESGILLRDLQFNGNNLAAKLLKIKNAGWTRLENVTFQDNGAAALYLECVIQSTFDQLYFANVGATGTKNGALTIDTGTTLACSELRFRDVAMEQTTGRMVEFVQSGSSVSSYQIIFENLKLEDGGSGRSSAAGDYQVILDKVDHVKFINPLFSSKILGAGTLQNAQVYIGPSAGSVNRDIVFTNPVFFNNADVGQATAITSYVYIDNNSNGIVFDNPLFRETSTRQSYCLFANGSTTNVRVNEPRFINWTFPVSALNLAFANDNTKFVITRSNGDTMVFGPPVDTNPTVGLDAYLQTGLSTPQLTNADLILADSTTAILPTESSFLFVTSAQDQAGAIYQLRGVTHATVEINDPQNIFTVVKDSANSINIYWDTANYFIQNKTGGSRNIVIVRMASR